MSHCSDCIRLARVLQSPLGRVAPVGGPIGAFLVLECISKLPKDLALRAVDLALGLEVVRGYRDQLVPHFPAREVLGRDIVEVSLGIKDLSVS